MRRRLLAALLLLAPTATGAQALHCSVPSVLPRQSVVGEGEHRRVTPIGGYTLALSWSPEYCRARGESAEARLQCGGAGRFGFILHGLWPEGARAGTWPQWCRRPALVPERVVRATLCAMPSVALIQHEWEKHGSCGFANAESYFRASRILFAAVRYPDMNRLSRRDLDAGSFARHFAAANPGLDAAMIRVDTNHRGWLEGVRLCLDRRFRPQSCPADHNGPPDHAPVRIWRSQP